MKVLIFYYGITSKGSAQIGFQHFWRLIKGIPHLSKPFSFSKLEEKGFSLEVSSVQCCVLSVWLCVYLFWAVSEGFFQWFSFLQSCISDPEKWSGENGEWRISSIFFDPQDWLRFKFHVEIWVPTYFIRSIIRNSSAFGQPMRCSIQIIVVKWSHFHLIVFILILCTTHRSQFSSTSRWRIYAWAATSASHSVFQTFQQRAPKQQQVLVRVCANHSVSSVVAAERGLRESALNCGAPWTWSKPH